ncbi:MAG TPA: hypothetical protein VGG28_10795 [Kofleriaceae bacterium]|jgi:hypothetical protein
MLSGAHVITFSSNATADAAFLRDVLSLGHVDAGEGFLIFGLPPSELAMHEADASTGHGKTELYFIVDDIEKFIAHMTEQGVPTEAVADRGWGLLSSVALPSGIKLGVYEARHVRPASAGGAVKAAKKAAKQAKKAAKALVKSAKAVHKATKQAKKAGKKSKSKSKK